MPSYYRKIIFLLLFNSFLFANSDLLILQALDYKYHHQFGKSADIFKKIYNKTKKEIYLKEAIDLYLQAKEYDKITYIAKNYNNIKDKKIKKSLLLSYIYVLTTNKNYEKALKLAKELLKIKKDVNSYKIVGEIYFNLKQYKNAANYFESAYIINQDKSALLKLADTLFAYLNQKNKAISYLQTYKDEHGCDDQICLKLVIFYEHMNNLDGVISILNNLYKKYSLYSRSSFKKYIGLMLSEALSKKDIKKAILFLEKEHIDDKKLMSLYARTNQFEKAYKLIKKKYIKTKDKKLLAQIAILEYEMVKDKKKMLPHVIANFEIALKHTQDARYLNYYGYILIDHDINIKKGLNLVKKAYKKYPQNVAYADSVAWGYYKLKKCKQAYNIMKKVVNRIGLDNKEIKTHWNKIKKCYNSN